jgi:hypothetical protein
LLWVAIFLLYLYNMESEKEIAYHDAGAAVFYTAAGKSEVMAKLFDVLSTPMGNVSRIGDNELALDYSSGLTMRRVICRLSEENGRYMVSFRFCRRLTYIGDAFVAFLCIAAMYFLRHSLDGSHSLGIIIVLSFISFLLLGIAYYYAFGFVRHTCHALKKEIAKITF